MRRIHARAFVLAAMLAAGTPANAWLIYTDRDDPSQWVVEIEKPYGDLVALRSLPRPFDRLVRAKETPEPLLYRWTYEREAIGSAILAVDEAGQARIEFEFVARDLIEGQRLGAAVVLVGNEGRPLHTFYARADSSGGVFADGTRSHRVRLAVDRAPGWWRQVDAIAFFYMSYHPLQKLDDDQVWTAMRRAVRNFVKAQGTEQRE